MAQIIGKIKMSGKGWDNKIHKVFKEGRTLYITGIGNTESLRKQKYKVSAKNIFK